MVEDIASIGGINCRNRIGKGRSFELAAFSFLCLSYSMMIFVAQNRKVLCYFFFHFSEYEYQWLERSAYKVQHSAQVFCSCPPFNLILVQQKN